MLLSILPKRSTFKSRGLCASPKQIDGYNLFAPHKKDEQIIAEIEKNKINTNAYTNSVYGNVPIFFGMATRPKVFKHFVKKRMIEPNLKMKDAFDYKDFLDICDLDIIKNAHNYGFNLSYGNYTGKYLRVRNVERARKFIECGILKPENFKSSMSLHHLEQQVKETYYMTYSETFDRVRVPGLDRTSTDLNFIIDLYKKAGKLDTKN